MIWRCLEILNLHLGPLDIHGETPKMKHRESSFLVRL